jgi:hypothetical protein
VSFDPTYAILGFSIAAAVALEVDRRKWKRKAMDAVSSQILASVDRKVAAGRLDTVLADLEDITVRIKDWRAKMPPPPEAG